MKISVNDQEIFRLSDTQKKVLKNDISEEIFENDMGRRLQYILTHKYEECFKRLKTEWEPRLKAKGVSSIPLDDEVFAEFVFSQPEYRDRAQRERGV